MIALCISSFVVMWNRGMNRRDDMQPQSSRNELHIAQWIIDQMMG